MRGRERLVTAAVAGPTANFRLRRTSNCDGIEQALGKSRVSGEAGKLEATVARGSSRQLAACRVVPAVRTKAMLSTMLLRDRGPLGDMFRLQLTLARLLCPSDHRR